MMKLCLKQLFQQVRKERIFIKFSSFHVETSSRLNSTMSARSSVSSNDNRPTPLIKLYVKPYRGKRTSDTNPIYSVSSITKVNHLFSIILIYSFFYI